MTRYGDVVKSWDGDYVEWIQYSNNQMHDEFPFPEFKALLWTRPWGTCGGVTFNDLHIYKTRYEDNMPLDFGFKFTPHGIKDYTLYATKSVAYPATEIIVRCDKCGAKVVEAKVREIDVLTTVNTQSSNSSWGTICDRIAPLLKKHTERHQQADERS